jgi:hypothetical protein
LIISNSTDYRVNVAYSDTTSDSNVSEDESDLDTDDIEKHPLVDINSIEKHVIPNKDKEREIMSQFKL